MTCARIRSNTARCLARTLRSRVSARRLHTILGSILSLVEDLAAVSKQFNQEADALSLHRVPGVSDLMTEMFTE